MTPETAYAIVKYGLVIVVSLIVGGYITSPDCEPVEKLAVEEIR